MSNAPENSRESGDSRRRRSRGGQNRRNNNNNNSERRKPDGRQSGGGKREGGTRSGGARQNTGKPQRRPMPAPIKLNWWQKLLKTLGLYKEPVRPPRPERRPDASQPKKSKEPRRSKTRDARSQDSGEGAKGDSPRRKNEAGGRGKKQNNRPRGGDPATVENRRVYVGNLSYDVTESDLEELFKGVGPVRRVEIVYNRNTHRSKGYGFIEMLDIDEAKRTVEVLHDQFFMGRKLTVSGAKSQDHADAEKDEEQNQTQNQEMPPLAPLEPVKEEVTSLLDEAPAKQEVEKTPEITTETVKVEDHRAQVPTEEFSPEADTPESIKDQPVN
ncbi:RNA recognition motif domain-containing protein [Luteolibacter algae]|uniref:RNA recognition motif domain-containing protein n=1 Tax=Luteolibacter algae TaxID=454151 RepID=A0ABW5DBF2_9BACT